MKKLINNLTKAFDELDKEIQMDDEDKINNEFLENFPFDKCFSDLTADVKKWNATVQKASEIKYLIKEIPPESTDLSFYFEDDGLSEASGDFNNTLFVLYRDRRNYRGFNDDVYEKLIDEFETMLDDYETIGTDYGNYASADEFLADYDKKYVDLLEFVISRSVDYTDSEYITDFLSLKTGKEWNVKSVTGYSQGDYVEVIYCEGKYYHPEIYGEIWLGMGREFSVTNLELDDACYGLIIADSQVNDEIEYKKLVCDWCGIAEAEAELQLIDDYYTYTEYKYKTL